MSIYEFDEEREMKLIRESEREIGECRIRTLYKHLLSDNRIGDLKKLRRMAFIVMHYAKSTISDLFIYLLVNTLFRTWFPSEAEPELPPYE